jgi:beta-lactam-binding protein with PASTA domain
MQRKASASLVLAVTVLAFGASTAGALNRDQASPERASARCVVPNLHALGLAVAKRRLKKAHCSLGKVKILIGKARLAEVVKQHPKPGVVLKAGARVNVTALEIQNTD